MRSDHLTKHAKRHPEFNFTEFIHAKKRLDDLVGLEQVDLNCPPSPSQQHQQKSKIFLPTIDNTNQNPTSTNNPTTNTTTIISSGTGINNNNSNSSSASSNNNNNNNNSQAHIIISDVNVSNAARLLSWNPFIKTENRF